MITTDDEKTNRSRAKALLTDIEGAPSTLLPRRETIVSWLKNYLVYAKQVARGGGEISADLIALEQFLRDHRVPIAIPSAA